MKAVRSQDDKRRLIRLHSRNVLSANEIDYICECESEK